MLCSFIELASWRTTTVYILYSYIVSPLNFSLCSRHFTLTPVQNGYTLAALTMMNDHLKRDVHLTYET